MLALLPGKTSIRKETAPAAPLREDLRFQLVTWASLGKPGILIPWMFEEAWITTTAWRGRPYHSLICAHSAIDSERVPSRRFRSVGYQARRTAQAASRPSSRQEHALGSDLHAVGMHWRTCSRILNEKRLPRSTDSRVAPFGLD
jgi:hypothetical protein